MLDENNWYLMILLFRASKTEKLDLFLILQIKYLSWFQLGFRCWFEALLNLEAVLTCEHLREG